jgi:hypothetical protein
MLYGVWCMVCGVWCMVYGVWCMVSMVYGVWCMVYGVLHLHEAIPVDAKGQLHDLADGIQRIYDGRWDPTDI